MGEDRMGGDGAEMTAREGAWTLDGLDHAGLEWGAPGGVPVLALHGWMDHGGSFAALAPHLSGCHVVAPDLSGFGRSAHRAAHATYNIWDDLPQMLRLMDRLGWEDCVVMGHSRGAGIGALLAAAAPERVRALVALDALAPDPAKADVVATLRAFLKDTRAALARPPRSFASEDAYVARRAAQGNSEATARALAPRGLTRSEGGGVAMRADPRHFASSAMKLTEAESRAVLRAVEAPVLNLWAAGGIRATRPGVAALAAAAPDLVARYESADFPGDHHFHLDPDIAPGIAAAILDFLGRARAGG